MFGVVLTGDIWRIKREICYVALSSFDFDHLAIRSISFISRLQPIFWFSSPISKYIDDIHIHSL